MSPTGAAAKGIPLKLETSPSVTPRNVPAEVRTVGAAVGAAGLEEVPVPVCANVHGALIKHNPRMAKFDFTFGSPFLRSVFRVSRQVHMQSDGGRD